MGRGYEYSGNLIIGCMAGVLQMAGTIFGLVYGTREPGILMLVYHHATDEGFAGKQREMYDRFTLESEYRCNTSGAD